MQKSKTREMQKRLVIIAALALVLFSVAAWLSHAGAGVQVERRVPNSSINSFRIADYYGGWHLGPCGLGRAIKWGYTLDLTGSGPRYSFADAKLTPNSFESIRVVAGEIILDEEKQTLTIALRVGNQKSQENFVGNGNFKINERR